MKLDLSNIACTGSIWTCNLYSQAYANPRKGKAGTFGPRDAAIPCMIKAFQVIFNQINAIFSIAIKFAFGSLVVEFLFLICVQKTISMKIFVLCAISSSRHSKCCEQGCIHPLLVSTALSCSYIACSCFWHEALINTTPCAALYMA